MNKTAGAAFLLLFSLSTGCASVSAKDAGNFPYVHSDLDGRFYARSIPKDTSGHAGKTVVFKVLSDADQPVDSYDWYCKNGLRLGWSPITGKIAVLAIKPHDDFDLTRQTELEFYLGGKKLMSYSTEDMQKRFGAPLQQGRDGIRHAQFIVYGCRQVPGTNEYNFVVNIAGSERSFDILTGKERPGSAVKQNEGEQSR